MEKAKHTPGPWEVVAANDYEIHAAAIPDSYPHHFKRDDLGRFVCLVGNRTGDFGEADAHLISAAPDLLAALKAWEHWYNDDSTEFNREMARAAGLKAIAKAEGTARRAPTSKLETRDAEPT